MADTGALRIRVTGPDGACTESRLTSESVIIGSGPAAGVKVADSRVSSLHLMLKRDSRGRVTAIDLGSEHGTRKGAQLLEVPVLVSPGEVLQIGESRIEISIADSPAARSCAPSLPRS